MSRSKSICPVDPVVRRNLEQTDLSYGVEHTRQVNMVNHYKFTHSGIPIQRVAERLGGKYSKESFQYAMIRLKLQGITAFVFTPGTGVLVGCKGHMKAREAAQELLSAMIKHRLIPSDTLIMNHHTENRVNSFDLNSPINLFLFKLDVALYYDEIEEGAKKKKIIKECYEYDPGNFHGFHWKIFIAGKLTTAMIFSSGRVAFTGTRDPNTIHLINALFVYILTHYIQGHEYRQMNEIELESFRHYELTNKKKIKIKSDLSAAEIAKQQEIEERERERDYLLELTARLEIEGDDEEIIEEKQESLPEKDVKKTKKTKKRKERDYD